MGGDEASADTDQRASLVEAISQLPLDPAAQSDALAMYDFLIAADDSKEAKAAALQTVQSMVMGQMQQREQQSQSRANALALQSVIADHMQPYAQQLTDSAQAHAGLTEQLASQLPDAYQGIAKLQASQSLNAANRTAASYLMQASLLPTMQMVEQQQQLQAQMAQQAQAQSISGGAGNQLNFNDLLTQQALAPTG